MSTTRIIQRTADFEQGLMLGQVRPSSGSAAAIYSPAEGIQTETDQMEIANTSTSVVLVEVFHDKAGSAATASECIFIHEIPAQETITLDLKAYMTATVETMSVRASVTSSVTFTLYGRETQERAR